MEEEGFNRIPDVHLKSDNKDSFYSNGYSIFDVSFQDQETIEKRLYKTICFFLDKYEKVTRVKDFYTLVDRFVVCNDIISCEVKY